MPYDGILNAMMRKSNAINAGRKKFFAKRERAFQDTLKRNGKPAGHRRYTPPRKAMSNEQ